MRDTIQKVVNGIADGTISTDNGITRLNAIIQMEIEEEIDLRKPETENPKVTVLSVRTSSTLYQNAVIHGCSFHEFLQDMNAEIKKFLKEGNDSSVNAIDVFWHLSEHCDRKYGRCHWESLSMDDLRDVLLADSKKATK